ncbi:hypothetical protein [Peribacillus asahii]|uniref:Uncharacterized protein n=1 Tax=Peribacillus asahii TaxID=228899 RepID=A0A3T0KM08_9BACI|nr:hypothetical protein [Peribacillus asahii]AZV41406.1 hypothetical protein BAOM_0794 [Peribacillus asahii]USK70901.1 hypothetical protein LIS76_03810 [Peribacillus asahii]USK85810.1 hypothetical protein LIT35_03950 [Peribacillus asahii]HWL25783.1 hypothetical protein [Ureibacillus sp.]
MRKRQLEEILNMPDLLFSQLCEERYEINKGVYNTIDRWFYNQGLSLIVERREMILSFIQYISVTENQGKKVKFGSGGLTRKLDQFWEERIQTFKHKAM